MCDHLFRNVEFGSPPVAVGNESVQQFNNVKTPLGAIKMLHPVDSVKDWNDKQGLEQAINIYLEQEIDLNELKRWSLQENHPAKFQIFVDNLKKVKNS